MSWIDAAELDVGAALGTGVGEGLALSLGVAAAHPDRMRPRPKMATIPIGRGRFTVSPPTPMTCPAWRSVPCSRWKWTAQSVLARRIARCDAVERESSCAGRHG